MIILIFIRLAEKALVSPRDYSSRCVWNL